MNKIARVRKDVERERSLFMQQKEEMEKFDESIKMGASGNADGESAWRDRRNEEKRPYAHSRQHSPEGCVASSFFFKIITYRIINIRRKGFPLTVLCKSIKKKKNIYI